MINTFYCSPSTLNLVMGSASNTAVHVKDFRQIPLPEGAMINGIITNVDIMTDFLETIANEYHLQGGATGENQLLRSPTRIIIQASNIVTKIMEVPPVDEAQMRAFIKREFTQYADASDEDHTILYDYTVLNQIGPQGGIEILAASSGRDMIEDYRCAFEQATYNVEQIGIAVESLIKLTCLLPHLVGKTYLLTQVEPGRQTNTIFSDGTYRISNGYRLIGEPQSSSWVGEIGQNIASTLQFIRAQRGQTELNNVFLSGINHEAVEHLTQEFGYLNVGMGLLDLSGVITVSEKIGAQRNFEPGALLYNLGALVRRV
ncbi:MAG: hypothetical protein FWD27_00085 [Coriobacteriia bacterium]|nr:hypothetical protein [Coriobacteriia bacterium]